MIKDLQTLEAWFVTGSQHLYGEKTLQQVDHNSQEIAAALDNSSEIPVRIVFKPVLTTAEAILAMDVLIKLDTKDKSSSRKGAFLYRFDQKKYQKLMEGGYNFTI